MQKNTVLSFLKILEKCCYAPEITTKDEILEYLSGMIVEFVPKKEYEDGSVWKSEREENDDHMSFNMIKKTISGRHLSPKWRKACKKISPEEFGEKFIEIMSDFDEKLVKKEFISRINNPEYIYKPQEREKIQKYSKDEKDLPVFLSAIFLNAVKFDVGSESYDTWLDNQVDEIVFFKKEGVLTEKNHTKEKFVELLYLDRQYSKELYEIENKYRNQLFEKIFVDLSPFDAKILTYFRNYETRLTTFTIIAKFNGKNKETYPNSSTFRISKWHCESFLFASASIFEQTKYSEANFENLERLGLISRKTDEFSKKAGNINEIINIKENKEIIYCDIEKICSTLRRSGVKINIDKKAMGLKKLCGDLNDIMQVNNNRSFENIYIGINCFKLTLLGIQFLRYYFPDEKWGGSPSFSD